jgi:hypothetical protein
MDHEEPDDSSVEPSAEELERMAGYWKTVKWAAQCKMLQRSNKHLLRVGSYAANVMTGVVNRMRGDAIDMGFLGWLQFCARKRSQHQRLRRAQYWLQKSAMLSLLRYWGVCTVESARKAGVVRRAFQKSRRKTLSLSFQAWQHVTATIGATARYIEEGQRKILHARVVLVFANWAALRFLLRVRRIRIERNLSRTMRRRTTALLHGWSSYGKTQRRYKTAISRAAVKRRLMLLGSVHDEWLAKLRHARIERVCKQRAQLRSKTLAVDTLRSYSWGRKQQQDLQSRVISSWQRRALRACVRKLVLNAMRRTATRARLQRARTALRHSRLRDAMVNLCPTKPPAHLPTCVQWCLQIC